jgi:hypothetical protein
MEGEAIALSHAEMIAAAMELVSAQQILVLQPRDEHDAEERISIDDLVVDAEHGIGEFTSDAARIDYEVLFDYLADSVKENDFGYDSYVENQKPKDFNFEDFQHPKLNDTTINDVLRAAKLKNNYGAEMYVHPSAKALFDMWKMCNDIEDKIRYDMLTI